MGMFNLAVSTDDTLYVGGEWKFYAFNTDGTLYIGSEAGFKGRPGRDRVHAIDLHTEKSIWSLDLPSDVTWSSPAIANGGVLYIGTMALDLDRGSVFAIQTDARRLLPKAGSPRFHLGNESSGRRNDKAAKTKSSQDG